MAWVPAAAILLFEDLQIDQPAKGLTRGRALRRLLSLWQHRSIRQAVTNKAELAGIAVAYVDPAHTSQRCNRCGLIGNRKRHVFTCPHCGHSQHADVNAAINIRARYVQSRLDGALSTAPEALPPVGEGKLPFANGSR
jgi:IS605 OrfB family transposase